jgi:hypothetical protein
VLDIIASIFYESASAVVLDRTEVEREPRRRSRPYLPRWSNNDERFEMFFPSRSTRRVVGVVSCALLGAVWAPGHAGAVTVRRQAAVVSSTGTLVRGDGATAASRLGPGTYTVGFSSAVRTCAYEATAGDPGASGLNGAIAVTVASAAGVPTGLRVQTFDQSTGALADEPFHVTAYCGAQDDFAVVGRDGTLARGSHVASSIRTHTGLYDVLFDHDVSKCTFTATLGSTGAGPAAHPGEITVNHLAGGVLVQTLSRAGNATDASFHLAVSCGAGGFTAVVRGDGSLARGSNTVSSAKLANPPHGAYEVIFDRDVTACAYTASVGTPGRRRLITDPVTISTAQRITNANGVFILITNVDGALQNDPFDLVVSC